jgi:hypothetical protein
MKLLNSNLIDLASTVAAVGVLFLLDSSGWAYLVLILFGMAQKYCGLLNGRAEVMRNTIVAVLRRVAESKKPEASPCSD